VSDEPATHAVPIRMSPGVRLSETERQGVSRVEVVDAEERFALPWDRFMRLRAVADHLRRITGECRTLTILDAGGFDGALAMFLPGHEVEVIDRATTGGSVLRMPCADRSYEAVVSIDAIEHVPVLERGRLVAEAARTASEICIINFPHPATLPAQKLLLSLTDHRLIREHVELGLPEKAWVIDQMASCGFDCQAIPHGSLAVFVSQFALQNLAPEAAAQVSRYLVQAHYEEPFTVPLYQMVVGTRSRR